MTLLEIILYNLLIFTSTYMYYWTHVQTTMDNMNMTLLSEMIDKNDKTWTSYMTPKKRIKGEILQMIFFTIPQLSFFCNFSPLTYTEYVMYVH